MFDFLNERNKTKLNTEPIKLSGCDYENGSGYCTKKGRCKDKLKLIGKGNYARNKAL